MKATCPFYPVRCPVSSDGCARAGLAVGGRCFAWSDSSPVCVGRDLCSVLLLGALVYFVSLYILLYMRMRSVDRRVQGLGSRQIRSRQNPHRRSKGMLGAALRRAAAPAPCPKLVVVSVSRRWPEVTRHLYVHAQRRILLQVGCRNKQKVPAGRVEERERPSLLVALCVIAC